MKIKASKDDILENSIILKEVREAIKKVTSGDLYDAKGYLSKEGYRVLETLEGLDLFLICDPEIKLVKKEAK